MRREAWGTTAAAVGTAQPSTPAGQQGRRAPPQTVQVAGPKSRTHDELRALAEGPTRSIFVYDLDSNIPASDLEHGLHGLFSVFGPVLRVSSLPGRLGALRAVSARSALRALGALGAKRACAPAPCAGDGRVRVPSVRCAPSARSCAPAPLRSCAPAPCHAAGALTACPLAGWKDTAQAMVAYGSEDHARQAMGRLQNFPIWGRPLRLAYAQEDGSPARGEDRTAPERPATAPQQRPAPIGLPSTAGDSSEAAGVRRRIWDMPEVRTEQEDARHWVHTQTPAVRPPVRSPGACVSCVLSARLRRGSAAAVWAHPCSFLQDRARAACPWLTPGWCWPCAEGSQATGARTPTGRKVQWSASIAW
jgi:hypothetical protein